MSFLRELKRRGVLRATAIYIVAAWAALQAAALIFPLIGLSERHVRLVLIMLALGLPVAIAVSWAFDFTARGLQRNDPNTLPKATPSTRFVILTLALLVFGLGAWYAARRVRGPAPDHNVVTIAPFRVSGADPALAYLREGLVDLIAAKLTGEGGPRSVDPRTSLASWKQATADPNDDLPQERALRVAASLGSGQLLLGELTGNAARLVLNARLITQSGQEARADVQGPQDSLTALVDQLVGQLLVRESTEGEQRLASLMTTSLDALRAYLAGRTLYRRGAYDEALPLFERALEFDSTFALAAMMATETGLWSARNTDRFVDAAWNHRERLSRRDLQYLMTMTGHHYARPPLVADVLEALGTAMVAAPDRPEMPFWYGDALFHHGPRMARSDWLDESERTFRRALELDSAFAAPIEHLIEIAIMRGDSARVRALGLLYFTRDSVSDLSDYVRWRVASAVGDRTALAALRARFALMKDASLVRIAVAMETSGETAELPALVEALGDPARKVSDPLGTGLTLMSVGTNHGWRVPRERGLRLISQVFPPLGDIVRVGNAGAWSADTAGLGLSLQTLRSFAAMKEPFSWLAEATLQQYALLIGDTVDAPALVRAIASDSVVFPYKAETAIQLDALHATLLRRPDAASAVAKFDSLMLRAPNAFSPPEVAVARLYQMIGNPQRALDVVRRRGFHFILSPMSLSWSYREEARLAAQVGDRAGAIKAYQRYIAMRATAESPGDKDELEAVKRELASLTTEVRR